MAGFGSDAEAWRAWVISVIGPKLSDRDFLAQFPNGDPGAIYCRWCGTPRRRIVNKWRGRLRSELECLLCDEQGVR